MSDSTQRDPSPSAQPEAAQALKDLATAIEGGQPPAIDQIRAVLAGFQATGLDRATTQMVIEVRGDAKAGRIPEALTLRMVARALAGEPARRGRPPGVKNKPKAKPWEEEVPAEIPDERPNQSDTLLSGATLSDALDHGDAISDADLEANNRRVIAGYHAHPIQMELEIDEREINKPFPPKNGEPARRGRPPGHPSGVKNKPKAKEQHWEIEAEDTMAMAAEVLEAAEARGIRIQMDKVDAMIQRVDEQEQEILARMIPEARDKLMGVKTVKPPGVTDEPQPKNGKHAAPDSNALGTALHAIAERGKNRYLPESDEGEDEDEDYEIPPPRPDFEWIARAIEVIENLDMPKHGELVGELYAVMSKLEKYPIPNDDDLSLLERTEREIEARVRRALVSSNDLPPWVFEWARHERARRDENAGS